MDAITLLTDQHRQVETLFAKLERAPAAERTRLLSELAQNLTGHMEIEEQLFYPAAYEADKDEAIHAAEEHEEAKPLLDELVLIGAGSGFHAKLNELKEMIAHHVKEEESELFPKCRKKIAAKELNELGEEMAQLFSSLQLGLVKPGSEDSIMTSG